MDERKIKLTIGVVISAVEEALAKFYKDSDKAKSYDFFEEKLNIKDKEILDFLIYKNEEEIRKQKLSKNNLAYINLAAKNFSRERNCHSEKNISGSFLASIFNNLNGNNKNGKYQAKYLSHDQGINYPELQDVKLDLDYYEEIEYKIQNKLKDLEINKDYISSLFEMLENYLTYVPISREKNKATDISLYDDIKMRATFANCIYDYFAAKNQEDFSLLSTDEEKSSWRRYILSLQFWFFRYTKFYLQYFFR